MKINATSFGRAALLTSASFAALIPTTATAQSQPTSFTTYHRFDALGREVGTIQPDPDGAGPLPFPATRSTYDADGRVIKVEKGSLATWLPDSVLPQDWTNFTVTSWTVSEYDIADRKTEETAYGSDGVAVSVVQYSYDTAGRLKCTALRMNPATYNSLPDACMWTAQGNNGPDRITQNEYDAGGRLLRLTKGVWTDLRQDYATFTYTPNGKQATIKDANGNLATYTYDGFDRLAAWSYPSKTTTGSSAPCTIGAITETTDEFGNAVTSPSETRATGDDCEKYGYDRNGNRAKLIKRDGSVIRYAFDALNQNTVKDIPGGTAADVYYGYDLRGLQTFARFASVSGLGVTNTYDAFGQLTGTTNNMGVNSLTLAYQYDADGNRIRLTHPDGTYFTYDYDGLDRATTVKANGSSTIATISYDSQGRRSGDVRGGVNTAYTYDPVSRIASMSNDLAGSASDVTSTFTYNPANQIVTKTRSNDAYAFSGYVSVSRPYTTNGLNQYATAGAANFTYDGNGNLTGDGTTAYTYDVENRLTSVTDSTGTTGLLYDPLGRLWREVVKDGTGSLEYLHDGDNIVERYHFNGTGSALNSRYVFGPGTDEPIIVYWTSSLTNPESLQSDYEGSIVSVADATGNLLGVNTYDEYGIQTTTISGSSPTFGYTGQIYLQDIGLNYYKARMYSPTLGRFLQTDPIGYEEQMGLYNYVGNDPINGRDSKGTRTDLILMDKNYSPGNAFLVQHAETINIPGVFLILGHINWHGIENRDVWHQLNGTELFQLVEKQPTYKAGQLTFIMTCLGDSTAVRKDGTKKSVLRDFANAAHAPTISTDSHSEFAFGKDDKTGALYGVTLDPKTSSFDPNGTFVFVDKNGNSTNLGNAVRFDANGTLVFGNFNDDQTVFTVTFICDRSGCHT